MEMSSYERYGLHGNPFLLDDKGMSLQTLEIYHVTQPVDDELALLKEGAFNRENKTVVMLVGPPGIGKTHRLLLASREAELNNMFYVFYDISTGSPIAAESLVQVFLKKKQKRFSQPLWMKSLQKHVKGMNRGYDPRLIGSTLAEALNAQVPAFFLINGFHKLPQINDADRFLTMLIEIIDRIQSGVCMMMECDSKFFSGLTQTNQGFAARVKRQVTIPAMTNEEARLLLAKRMLVKRMVEDVDPLYPFTPEAVNLINTRSHGIPHVLLEQANYVFDDATKRRVIMIDDGYVQELFRLNNKYDVIDEVLTEEQPDLEVVDDSKQPKPLGTPKTPAIITPVEPENPASDLKKKRKRRTHTASSYSQPIIPPPVSQVVNPQKSMEINPTNDNVNVELPLDDSTISSNITDISNEPFESSDESDSSEENVSTKFIDDSWKPLHQSTESDDSEKPVKGKKVRRLKSTGLLKFRSNTNLKKSASSNDVKSLPQARIQCPNCSKIFTTTISHSIKKIQCPHCQFHGKIKQYSLKKF